MARPTPSARPSDKGSLFDEIFVAFLSCLPVGLFLIIIYNRFLPIQDAWFENYGRMMQQGKVPYRDFYFFTQPFSLITSRIIVAISDKLIYFKYYACLERLALTACLYWLLRQQFSKLAAFIGTVCAVIGMSSFDADGLFSYFYTTILFLLLAIGFLMKAVRVTPDDRSYLWVSGFFIGLSFFTKQSLGLIMGVAFFCTLLVISSNLKIAFTRTVSFGAGFALACLPFLIWIVGWGLSFNYYNEVFFSAGSQKGGLLTIFTAFFSRLIEPSDFETFLALGIITYLLYRRRFLSFRSTVEGDASRSSARYVQFTAILFMGTIGYSLFFSTKFLLWYIQANADEAISLCPSLVFYLLFIFGVLLLRKRGVLSNDRRFFSQGMIILVICSLGIMYATGMSYQIQEQALVPGLGICLACVIDYAHLGRGALMKYVVIAFSCLFMVFATTKKYVRTFVWYGWSESLIHEVVASPIPKLEGFALDPSEQVIYQRICEIIEGSCGPDDTVFTFPNCPMFNYLTDRPQPTFAAVHYWDVCPDQVAINDAALLQARPPKVIVWLRAPWPDINFQEQAFRNGRFSGYSHLSYTLKTLIQNHAYKRMDILQLSTRCYPIEVWVRLDDSSPKTSTVFYPSFPLN